MSELAIIAIGANLGDGPATFRAALELLRAYPWWDDSSLLLAPIYRTTPVDCPPGSPDFWNSALAFSHPTTPEALLEDLQKIEVALGRPTEHGHNAPRTVDLDIIFYADQQLDTAQLTIPHPRYHERRFVLQPVADILPNFVPPGTGHTMREALDRLPDDALKAEPGASWRLD